MPRYKGKLAAGFLTKPSAYSALLSAIQSALESEYAE